MYKRLRIALAPVALAAFAPPSVSAQVVNQIPAPPARNAVTERVVPPAPVARPTPTVITTHQIDRFDAIRKEQAALAADPNSLADWIILGELAQEVAMDVPGDMATKYLAQSRNAFEKALAIDPANPGVKAAVQFARDLEKGMPNVESSRDAATEAFLNARRRDLKAMRYTPSVRVVSSNPPLPARELPAAVPAAANAAASPATPSSARAQAAVDAKTDPKINAASALDASPGTAVPVAEATPAVTPARERAPSTDAANYGTQANYSANSALTPTIYPGAVVYQPFTTPAGAPYTYGQYAASYFPLGVLNDPNFDPVTVQRYGYPVLNAFERGVLRSNVPVTAPPR